MQVTHYVRVSFRMGEKKNNRKRGKNILFRNLIQYRRKSGV